MTKNKNKKSSEAAKQEAFKLSEGICCCKTPGLEKKIIKRLKKEMTRMGC